MASVHWQVFAAEWRFLQWKLERRQNGGKWEVLMDSEIMYL